MPEPTTAPVTAEGHGAPMFKSVDGELIEFTPYGRIETVEQAGDVYGDACARLWADSASTTPEFRNGIVQLREALAAHYGIAEFEIFKTLGTAEHVEELEFKYREQGNGLAKETIR